MTPQTENEFPELDILIGWQKIADYLDVHKDTARRWAEEKGMPFARVGGRTVFSSVNAIDEWKIKKKLPRSLPPVDPVTANLCGVANEVEWEARPYRAHLLVGWRTIGTAIGIDKVTARRWADKAGFPYGITDTPQGEQPFTTYLALQLWIDTFIEN